MATLPHRDLPDPERAAAAERLLAAIDLPQRSRRGSFEAVLALVDGLPRGRALDLPCGPGRLAEALRRMGFAVTAADLDGAGFAAHGVPFARADLDGRLPFADASFDLVHCGDGIEHLENPFAALRELARVLAPGGSLVLATPNYSNLERRLRFWLTGSLTKPLPRAPRPAAKRDRGHINPLTLTRVAHMAEEAGLELASVRTLGRKPRQWWLAPLALPIWLHRACLSSRTRSDLFADVTLSARVLLGGHKLLLAFRKAGLAPAGGPRA
jgi:SAM-dependent methyltransferase